MTMFNAPPPIEKPPEFENSLFFEALPDDGMTAFVLVASNYINNYQTTYQGQPKTYEHAIELFFATQANDGKYYFVKTWPKSYSMHEMSWYSALVKAITGSLPEAGSNVDQLIGLPLMLLIKNEDKVSKKGTRYVSSKIDGKPVPLPKGMPSPDPDEASKAFEVELARQEAVNQPEEEGDVPF